MNPNSPYEIKMILQNEDGQVLQEFPNCFNGYIYAINGDFKMCTSNGSDNSTYIYNLPGIVLDFPDVTNYVPSISLYPNPCTSIINVEYPLYISNLHCSLKILNIYGIEVKNVRLAQSSQTQIHVDDLEPGAYIYKIVNGQDVLITGKFVVER